MSTETIQENAAARQAARTLMDMGCDLAKEEGLSADGVRHLWKCVMEASANIIGHDPYKVETIEAPAKAPMECEPDDVMPFGKFAGEPMDEVPDWYWQWLRDQDWLDKWTGVVAYMEQEGLI